MSAIVALIDGAEVWIGSDSASIGGDELTVRKDAKVFRAADVVFGFASNFRVGQQLRYQLDLPDAAQLSGGYLVREFVPAFRDLVDGELTDKDREAGFSVVIGGAGRIFVVHGDYQVEEPADPYVAAGAGGSVALGALYATEGRVEARKRVLVALEAAERFTSAVRGPFRILSTGVERLSAEAIYSSAAARTADRLDRDRATWCDPLFSADVQHIYPPNPPSATMSGSSE